MDVVPNSAISAGRIDSDSRALMAQNVGGNGSSTYAPVTMNKVSNNSTVAKQPGQRASSLSQDPSFVRNTGKDIMHPVVV